MHTVGAHATAGLAVVTWLFSRSMRRITLVPMSDQYSAPSGPNTRPVGLEMRACTQPSHSPCAQHACRLWLASGRCAVQVGEQLGPQGDQVQGQVAVDLRLGGEEV